MHCLAPPPLFGLITFKSNTNRVTRGAARRDCIIPLKKTAFSQAVFSFTASHEWNSIPPLIRESTPYYSFKINVKKWLIENQHCQH